MCVAAAVPDGGDIGVKEGVENPTDPSEGCKPSAVVNACCCVAATGTVDAVSLAFAFFSLAASFLTALKFTLPCSRLASLADGWVFFAASFRCFVWRLPARLRAAFLELNESPFLQQS